MDSPSPVKRGFVFRLRLVFQIVARHSSEERGAQEDRERRVDKGCYAVQREDQPAGDISHYLLLNPVPIFEACTRRYGRRFLWGGGGKGRGTRATDRRYRIIMLGRVVPTIIRRLFVSNFVFVFGVCSCSCVYMLCDVERLRTM